MLKCVKMPFENMRYNLKFKRVQRNGEKAKTYTIENMCLVLIKLWSCSRSKCTCSLNFILCQTIGIGIFQTHSNVADSKNNNAWNEIKLNYWNILQNQIKLDTSNWLNMPLCICVLYLVLNDGALRSLSSCMFKTWHGVWDNLDTFFLCVSI